MGSDDRSARAGVGVRRTSSFLFFCLENNYTSRTGRRESARRPFRTSQEVYGTAWHIRRKRS